MKIVIITIFIFLAFTQAEVTQSQNLVPENPQLPYPFDFCNVESATMGFFAGTEKDPTVANSNCVIYFPTLQKQFLAVVNGFNSSLIIPTNYFGWVDKVATLINRYALWQNYCTFSTLFTRLDNVVQNLEGITTLLYRIMMNYANIIVKISDFTTNFQKKDCYNSALAIGEIFSMALDFNVPEDIV